MPSTLEEDRPVELLASIESAQSECPGALLPAIRDRFSAFSFDSRPVPPDVLRILFEAARQTPSSFNEQPWRYWVGMDENPEIRNRLRDLLVEGNRWARKAPVLILSAASTRTARNNRINRHAWHDLGAANHSLMIQAQAMGLSTHAMGGFDLEAAAAFISDPDIEPVAMIAVGYPGDDAALEEGLRSRLATRGSRNPIDEFVFTIDKSRTGGKE